MRVQDALWMQNPEYAQRVGCKHARRGWAYIYFICHIMGRNVPLVATRIGNLAVQRNSNTGKFKGVIPSGKKGKRQARAWCPRRKRFIPLGTFPTSPEAAVAVASAEQFGIENVPTPQPRQRMGGARRARACIAIHQPQRPACRLLTEPCSV